MGSEQTASKANDVLSRIQRELNELFNTVNDVLSSNVAQFLLPDWILEKIKALLKKVERLINKFIDKVQKYLALPGMSDVLRQAGSKWDAQVGGDARANEDDVNSQKMKVYDYWRGNAARSYQTTLDTQNSTYDDFAELTRAAKGWLDQAADAIEEFWDMVVIAGFSLAAGIGTCIGACATGVGTPAGLAALVVGVLGAIGAVVLAANSYEGSAGTIKEAMSQMKAQKTSTTFNNGWPQATTTGGWKAD